VWRRAGIGVVVLVVVLVAVGFAWQWLVGDRATAQLQFTVAHLDESDPSWRLHDLDEAREKVPPEENSAGVVVTVSRQLPRGWPTPRVDEQIADATRTPTTRLDATRTALLEQELASVAAALREARTLARMPRGRHRLTFADNPLGTLLPDQQETRRVATLLQYDALLRAQKGDMRGAVESCRAIVNAGRSLGDEPIAISQLIRIAIVVVACRTTERVLAQGEAAEEDLAALQKLLTLEEKHPTLLVAVRGERALSNDLFEKMEDGRIPTQKLFQELGARTDFDLKTRLLGLSRATIHRERRRTLEILTRMVETARLPEHEQQAEERKIEETVRSLPRDAVLTRMLLPAMMKMSDAFRRKSAQGRCLLAALAVERYRLEKKAWPDKLADLVPKYLETVPLDPYDGKPLRYRKRTDGVTVYSIGPDGTDDGGKLDRTNPIKPGTDLGCELWDVKARRSEPPPPAPGEKP
jgi:hypothetical protein